jgi:hypothetical protein
MMIASVDDQNVTLAHFGSVFDHLRRIDLVVARRIREIHDHARPDEKVVECQRGDVLARREKVDLAVQVRAQMVGMGKKLAIGPTYSSGTTPSRSHWASIP